MTLETFALVLLMGFFIWRLYRAFDKEQKLPSDKIRLVSKETGEVLEMHIVKKMPTKAKVLWDEDAFLMGAKFAFQKILTAFAACDLKTLKNTLSYDVYQAFEADILNRKQNKQKMDFSLICFDSAKVLQKNATHDEITVQFVSEQINLLKDEKGTVLEGDPMSVATMMDTWIFKKIAKDSWLITGTESRMAPCEKA